MIAVAFARGRRVALAVVRGLAAGSAQAERFNGAPARTVGPFESGQAAPQPVGGWTAPDDATLGASLHGQGGWAVNCTAARYDQEVTHAQAYSGVQSWRVSNGFHEGCVRC